MGQRMGEEGTVRFIATLAGVNTRSSPITIHADGDARLVFEVPQSELANVMRLSLLSKRSLIVTVRPE